MRNVGAVECKELIEAEVAPYTEHVLKRGVSAHVSRYGLGRCRRQAEFLGDDRPRSLLLLSKRLHLEQGMV